MRRVLCTRFKLRHYRSWQSFGLRAWAIPADSNSAAATARLETLKGIMIFPLGQASAARVAKASKPRLASQTIAKTGSVSV